MIHGRTALYRLYGEEDLLLYVGITWCVPSRMVQHGREKYWWDQMRRVDVEWHESRRDALAAEAHAIRTDHPIHNRDGRPEGTHESLSWDQLVLLEPALLELEEALIWRRRNWDQTVERFAELTGRRSRPTRDQRERAARVADAEQGLTDDERARLRRDIAWLLARRDREATPSALRYPPSWKVIVTHLIEVADASRIPIEVD